MMISSWNLKLVVITIVLLSVPLITSACSQNEKQNADTEEDKQEEAVSVDEIKVVEAIEGIEVTQRSERTESIESAEAVEEVMAPTLDVFSKDMKLEILFDSWEMGDFAKFFISRSESYANGLKQKSLLEINAESPTWNAQDMEDGLNHILDLVHSGVQVDYDYWSILDQEMDLEKRETKLFYFPGEEGAPFVLVNAGGGYTAVCSMVEAFPVAKRFNELGYNAFVLSYRVNVDKVVEKALEDEAEALTYIFDNAETFKISTDNYAVAGFSAGGNLTAEWGVAEKGYGKYELPKPASLFLVYGFISDINTVTADYPETYLVYCEDDALVSPDGLVALAGKFEEQDVKFDVNVGQVGGHGFGLGTGTDVEGWVEEAIGFWQSVD